MDQSSGKTIKSIAYEPRRCPNKPKEYARLLGKLECANPECESGYDIEVHHIIPLSRGGEDALWNMIPLCNDCHRHNRLHSDFDERKAELFVWKTYKELDSVGFALDEREPRFFAKIAIVEKARHDAEKQKRQLRKAFSIIKSTDKKLKKLELEVEDLKKRLEESEALRGKEMAEIRKRLTKLENPHKPKDSRLLDELYKTMQARGLKQTDFATAARMVKRSKARMLQLKGEIGEDMRFLLVPSESHSQKMVIRLRVKP